ncbi:hypothetical protein FHY34_003115 [Xanthomonas arboricola]|uniref:hypothetical protein n=1 Tax=Xanthomonas arboricola TaxID=56448 RepID=UPI0011B054D9|nr:hypothetical protein [Xanthomonas arboricola]MBB4709235.1 hypothetical protein [Xanthomonas arboricola]
MQLQTLFLVGIDAGADRPKDIAPTKTLGAIDIRVKTHQQECAVASIPAPPQPGRFPIPDSRFPIPDSRASVAHPETDADYPVAPEAIG